MGDSAALLKRVAELLERPTSRLEDRQLLPLVQSFHARREQFLDIARRHGSPLYVIEEAMLVQRLAEFREAFAEAVPRLGVYYALKSNNHPLVVQALVRAGANLDVSSGEELQLALAAGATHIVFSGPGKTETEMEQAIAAGDTVTVLIDSFGELERLEQVAARHDVRLRVGVRLTPDDNGIWRKFGIPLHTLPNFFEQAQRCPHIDLRGLQFHVSWNMTPDNQVLFIARLGTALRTLTKSQQQRIEFIDIGGGFWPVQGEWLQHAGTPEGILAHTAFPERLPQPGRFQNEARGIDTFASHIGRALARQVFSELSCEIFCEPGRWLCHDAMHMLVTVIDRKLDDLVITDGGTNAIGWDRFETDYFPVINLTRPAVVEHECYIMGSLCTPHDLWGYTYFGEDIQPGDVLLIPTQGAYTYSLRQHFIKPVPASVMIPHRVGGELTFVRAEENRAR
jgi:diaminopimelate decarboxylase